MPIKFKQVQRPSAHNQPGMPNWAKNSARNADAKMRIHLSKSETLRERVIGAARDYFKDDNDTGSDALNLAILELEAHLAKQPNPNHGQPLQGK